MHETIQNCKQKYNYIEYFNENVRGRKSLMNRLDKILDKDFSVGQISMFDDGLEDVFAIPKENVVEEVKEEVKLSSGNLDKK